MWGAFFCICEFFCVCVFTPYSHSALMWSLPDVLCGGVVWPLVKAPRPSPLFSSFNILQPILKNPFFCFFFPSSHLVSFTSLSSHSLLHSLPHSFFSNSSGVFPSSTGWSWSFLIAHRERLGFSRLSLYSPNPYQQRNKKLENAIVLITENHNITHTHTHIFDIVLALFTDIKASFLSPL